ncbi:hypothetical protein GGR51DRAFT_534423 [Nemania sp. FL0031]|nr:hypothetical protein GGR51DRAFT_534423 [Nemania sp. FL0031]
MEAVIRFIRYLWNLEWTERKQDKCIFCDPANLKPFIHQSDNLIAINSIRPAGQEHWLIIPRGHIIRDIEALGPEHIGLLRQGG